MATYDEMKVNFNEENFCIWSEQVHHYQLSFIDQNFSKAYGVKNLCAFFSLIYFKVTECFPPDSMHDVLEGIVPILHHKVICGLVADAGLTLAQRNYEIENFNYGQKDETGKLVLLSKTFLRVY